MNEECIGVNYNLAKAEADKIDARIIEALKSGHSFRVEAGAGSGKTYSLNRVIEWIQANKWSDYNQKKQNVICITYTSLHNSLACMECYQTVSECFDRSCYDKSRVYVKRR